MYLVSFLFYFFFFNDPAPTDIYTLSLHVVVCISRRLGRGSGAIPHLAGLSPRDPCVAPDNSRLRRRSRHRLGRGTRSHALAPRDRQPDRRDSPAAGAWLADDLLRVRLLEPAEGQSEGYAVHQAAAGARRRGDRATPPAAVFHRDHLEADD